jgi:hypothetical protein
MTGMFLFGTGGLASAEPGASPVPGLAGPAHSPHLVYAFSKEPVPLSLPDLSIAAGSKFILAADYWHYTVYDKATFPNAPALDLTGTDLDPECPNNGQACGYKTKGGTQTLFKNLWLGPGLDNVNHYVAQHVSYIPCDPDNPVQHTTTTPPGITTVEYSNHTHAEWPTSSCINDIYDQRVLFDRQRGRFWIMAHARSAILGDNLCVSENPSVPGAPPAGTCAAVNKSSHYFTFVAISNGEDPRSGYQRHVVSTDIADMPLFDVHNEFAFFYENTNYGNQPPHPDTHLRIYDADALAAGNTMEFGPHSPAKTGGVGGCVVKDKFASGYIRVARDTGKDPSFTTFVVAGSAGKLWVYAIVSPPTWASTAYQNRDHSNLPAVTDPLPFTNPLGATIAISLEALVYEPHDKSIYVAYPVKSGTKKGVIHLMRIPVSLSSDQKKVELRAGYKEWFISAPNMTFDHPSLQITDAHDEVVTFRASGSSPPMENHVRYSVRYHDEPDVRPSRPFATPGSGSPNPDGRIDFVGSALEPLGDQVWAINEHNGKPMIGVFSVRFGRIPQRSNP